MVEFKVIADCDICKEKKILCTEEILTTKENQQKVETWCGKCENRMLKEHYEREEELMYETYEDIIRSSY